MKQAKPEHEVIDDRDFGHLRIHNEVIDEYGPKVGAYGIAVYAVLCRFANGGRCFPSLDTIAGRLHISRNTVKKTLDVLVDAKLISIRHRPGNPAQGIAPQSSIYTILKVQKAGGRSGDDLLHEMTGGRSGDDRGVGQEMTPNKTKINKTNLTNGGDSDRLSAQDAAAALRSLGFDSELRRKVLAARSDLTQAELDPWSVWLLNPPDWSDKPFAFCAKALINRDAVPVERAKSNGKRTSSAVSEAPDYDINEAKRRGAAIKAEILKGLPEWA